MLTDVRGEGQQALLSAHLLQLMHPGTSTAWHEGTAGAGGQLFSWQAEDGGWWGTCACMWGRGAGW
jgi:hypothetical protein